MGKNKNVTSGELQKYLTHRIEELTAENERLVNACFIPKIGNESPSDRTLLASVMETSPVGITTVDLSGNLTYANSTAEKILGLERDLTGRRRYDEPRWHITDLDGEPFPQDRLPFPFVTKTGRPVYDIRYTVQWPDGRRIFLSVNAAPLPDSRGRMAGMVSVLNDISEQRLAEQALLRSEEQYRTLFTEIQEGFALHELICDECGAPADYRFLTVNPAFERLTGMRAGEMIGRTMRQVNPAIEPYCLRQFGQVVQTGLAMSFENYAGDLDRYFHINAFCPAKGQFAVLFVDISEKKRSEQLLTQEKERLAVTLRSIGEGVITTDINGNVVLMNKAAEALTGWTAGEAAGKPLPDVFAIVDEQTRTSCPNPVEQVLKTGDIVEPAEHMCLIARDGREQFIEDCGAPILDRNSRIIGVVLVFRDMTERRRLAESAMKAQKLESIGTLAGGIAHDFNNLLAGIFGYLEMARESNASGRPDEVQECITKALGVYFRARSLTQQLLTFSRGGTPVRKVVSLAPVLRNCAQFALSGSSVSCQFEIDGDLWPCSCDENQVSQVIDNIVINAKQAMPSGGKILISARNMTLRNARRGRLPDIRNYVKVSIRDEGAGMAKDVLTRIFDPFFSTKESGHGLGLPTAESILHRHNGWIEAESEPGKGSVFHFYLPASDQGNEADPVEAMESHTGTGTILVLDDEEFMLEIMSYMLKEMGYSIITSESGEEAIKRFKEAELSGAPVLACILDLTIPGHLGGRETLTEIRKIRPDTVIVAASGYSEDPIMANPQEHGFTDKIVKPFRKDDLAALIRRITQNK
jgi:PAS domain S-box-containing protein